MISESRKKIEEDEKPKIEVTESEITIFIKLMNAEKMNQSFIDFNLF